MSARNPGGLASSTPTEAAVAALTVSWSGIWIGAFASVVAVVLLGFLGTAVGAHAAGIEGRVTSWNGIGFGAVAFAVLAAFFAYMIGGWIGVRIVGVRDPETAAINGGVIFLVATVLLLALASQAAQYLNGWYSGLAPAPVSAPATPGQPVDPNIAKAARNSALAAGASMLLGLMGAVLGGWAASGEPMVLSARQRVAKASREGVKP